MDAEGVIKQRNTIECENSNLSEHCERVKMRYYTRTAACVNSVGEKKQRNAIVCDNSEV